MSETRKPIMWLHGEIKTPPFTEAGRIEAGTLLRLQEGEHLSMPHSRPMPSVGPRCHELRVRDEGANWRIIYRLDSDAVVVASVFAKTTPKTPPREIANCQRRLSRYDQATEEE
jgi:phage-related protein